MAEQNAKDFLSYVKEHPERIEEFKGKKPKEMLARAKALGYDFTVDEWKLTLESEDIPDEMLELVSGGRVCCSNCGFVCGCKIR